MSVSTWYFMRAHVCTCLKNCTIHSTNCHLLAIACIKQMCLITKCACLYLCMPISVHAYICACLYMCMPISVHAYICACLYLCMPISVHAYICACLYLCMPISVHAYICACLYLCMPISVHAYICAGYLNFKSSTNFTYIKHTPPYTLLTPSLHPLYTPPYTPSMHIQKRYM